MEHGVVCRYCFAFEILESCQMAFVIDRYEIVLEVAANSSLETKSIQDIRVFLDGEHAWGGGVEINMDILSSICLLVATPCHPHDLLRGPSTLYDTSGLREDGLARSKGFNIVPHLVTGIVRID